MIYLVIIAAALALCFAAFNYITVRRMPEGNETMQEIAAAIRVGANAFINYEYKVLYTVVAVVAVGLWSGLLGYLVGWGNCLMWMSCWGNGISMLWSCRVW